MSLRNVGYLVSINQEHQYPCEQNANRGPFETLDFLDYQVRHYVMQTKYQLHQYQDPIDL